MRMIASISNQMDSRGDQNNGNNDLLAYCGPYCWGCRNYQGNPGDFQCRGCRAEPRLAGACPARACAEGKGLAHCGQCDCFPCAELGGFYRDGKSHHALALKNIRSILADGPEKWLAEQDQKHTCRCGTRLSWFETLCPKCNK